MEVEPIIAALSYGAGLVGGGAGDAAGKEAYEFLKSLLMRRFEGRRQAQQALQTPEADFQAWRAVIADALIGSAAASDSAVEVAAQELLDLEQRKRPVTAVTNSFKDSTGIANSIFHAPVNIHHHNGPHSPPAWPAAAL